MMIHAGTVTSVRERTRAWEGIECWCHFMGIEDEFIDVNMTEGALYGIKNSGHTMGHC